jgi:hypothetical protein
MNYCAHNKNIDVSSHFSCFEMEELVEIANAFNDFIAQNNLCNKVECAIKRPIMNTTYLTKKELWNEIYYRLLPICKYEYCWVDLSFIKQIPNSALRKKIRYFTFKPKLSKHNLNWLYTSDIDYVLQQFEKKYHDTFSFQKTHPSDFYKLNSKTLSKDTLLSKKLVGWVINFDDNTKPGSHWVSLLVDNDAKTIEYFDSNGHNYLINKNITGLVHKIKQKLKDYTIKFNNVRLQSSSSGECGMFATYFIIRRILGDNFEKVIRSDISDSQMKQLRTVLFR